MPREILVVDDEATLCKALGALFSRKGIHVTTAGTAQDALQRIESINADIVLLDLKLPDASGLDVLSALREKLPDVRIVVISGNADQTMINEALERGASDYLAKPFDFDRCFYVAMGIETADLTAAEAEPQAIAKLPPELALRYQAFPIHWSSKCSTRPSAANRSTHRSRYSCGSSPPYRTSARTTASAPSTATTCASSVNGVGSGQKSCTAASPSSAGS